MFIERFRFGEAVADAGRRVRVGVPVVHRRTELEFDFWHVRVPDGDEAELHACLDEQSLDGLISRFSTGMVS